ncbi:glycosyltransferase [Nocardioides sp. W3-2-3]|nr:glycosyltransferase [Nocardioides convexus]
MKFEGVTAVIPGFAMKQRRSALSSVSCAPRACSEEVLVVDSLSEDATSEVARDAGARVVRARQSGLGAAMAAGVNASTTDRIFRTDADISDWDFGKIAEVATGGSDLMRGVFDSPYDDFPVTRLVAENICAVIFPGLKLPPRCLSGTYAFSRSKFPPPTYPPRMGV